MRVIKNPLRLYQIVVSLQELLREIHEEKISCISFMENDSYNGN